MTTSDDPLLPDEFDARSELTSFSATRHHVGEASLIQLDILEQIIQGGREQLVVTRDLRLLTASTLEQLRATPLGQINTITQEHRTTLDAIVHSGRAQIQTAHQLHLTIQHTLAQIRQTPLEQVSGHLLNTLSEKVHQQVEDLKDIIEAAVEQASSLEQIAGLEQVVAQAATRLQQVEHDREEHELAQLERQAAETLGCIRELERAGQSHAAQKSLLMAEAQTAEARIAALQQANAEGQEEIIRLEDQREVATAQQQALETAAEDRRQQRQTEEPQD